MFSNSSRPRRTVLAAIAAVATAAALLVGASPDASAAGSNTLTVDSGEYVYSLKGNPKSGYVQIDFNNGGVEYHMMGLVRLKPGVTVKQLKKALLSEEDDAGDDLVAGDGEVAPQPGILGPNQKTSMITELKAGHYGVFCYIPAPDGEPHIAHGMVKVFDIAKGKSSLTPPTDGLVDITLTDTSVTVPSTGIPGKGYARIVNNGTTARDFNFAQLNGTTTVAQADAYFSQLFETGAPAGTPPAVIAGGVLSIPKGGSVYVVLDFAKGRYAYASSDSNEEDDPNEIITEFTVT